MTNSIRSVSAVLSILLVSVCASVSFAGTQIDCSRATASPSELWPPNRQMVPITIQGLRDFEGTVTFSNVSVTQDEPLNGGSNGNACPDAEVSSTGGVSLRAERSGGGNGRVYVITFTATDATGSTCTGTVQVCVPADQRPGHTCTDDGQSVVSTGPCQ